MSRVRRYANPCEDENADNRSSVSLNPNDDSNCLDHEIAHLTKLRSAPHECFSQGTPGRVKLPVSTTKMLVGRESNFSGRGRFSSADCCHILSRYLPVKGPWRVDTMSSRAYVSQFSADGTLLIAGYQAGRIRIHNVDNNYKVQKDILTESLSWTITDACLSPDQRFLVYSSLSPVAHIVNVGSASTESLANVTEIHEGLHFSMNNLNDGDDDEFGIFSIKFSTDGQELVAATGDNSIYVYDLEENRCTLRIPAHQSDVNTVCFADDTGHLIYSGSDDHLCKVWDRRCFTARGQANGVLVGHLEGITYIESRGDGRHFISNGKDQTIKLWDIRKMSPNARHTPRFIRDNDWDYRWMEYPSRARTLKHPCDQSLATYSGHSVLHTLIRCHFSPEYSTGQKFIYTGSSDGSVYIYDLVSGNQVARLNHHEGPVRDCSWHPFYPVIISSSWDGSIAKWEFPGRAEAPASAPVRRRQSRRRFRL